MNFTDCFNSRESILMEGALGERLKREYADISSTYALPFLATTPTRRVNKESIEKSQFDHSIISANVKFLKSVQSKQRAEMFVGGMLGCHGDAYTGQNALKLKESEMFHEWEIKLFAEAGVDFLYAALIPNAEEAAGIALAIEKYRIPYIISFTIQRDGCLIMS